jgi:autotransporter-associated beta strand protein
VLTVVTTLLRFKDLFVLEVVAMGSNFIHTTDAHNASASDVSAADAAVGGSPRRSNRGLVRHLIPLVAAAVVVLATASPAAAQLVWGTSGAGGSGTWITGSANWWNGSTNVVWTSGNSGTFAGTAGTVTVSGSVQAGSLAFNTSGYSITGGTIGLASGTSVMSIGSGSVTISSILSGAGALQKTGGGLLTLNGANSYSGGTRISGGTVSVGNGSGLGTGAVTLAGGQLNIGGGVAINNAITLDTSSMAVSPFSVPGSLLVEYLLVAGGGGGGGDVGGGGGAGGVLTGSTLLGLGQSSVTVGAGGSGGNGSTGIVGASGANSTALGLTAFGGGGGGGYKLSDINGLSGGSGGGGGSNVSGNPIQRGGGGAGVAGQGYAGGTSAMGFTYGVGGGGGGAGGPGLNYIPGSQSPDGGPGTASTITGSSTYYGGGGGGSSDVDSPGVVGAGGAGGGGNGGYGANPGSANTGGGGGGGGESGGNGGSGIVVLRYLTASGSATATGGTVSTGTGSAAGYTIFQFKTTGSSTFTVTSAPTASDAVISGNISGTGGLLVNGTTSLVLSGSNTYTGDTSVASGTLQLDNRDALRGSTFTGGAGSLKFGSGTAFTFGGLSGSSAIALSNTAGSAVNLTVGGNNVVGTYSGVLSGAGALTKVGTELFTLTGNNSYSGATTISSGTLRVGAGGAISNTVVNNAALVFDRSGLTSFGGTISGAGSRTVIRSGTLALGAAGSIANSGTVIVGDAGSSGVVLDLSAKSSYTFAGGQTLGGKGTVLGANTLTSVTIAGVLSPGNSPGIMTFDKVNLVLGSTANTRMEITGTTQGSQYDAIVLTNGGLLTYGGTLTLDFGSNVFTTGDTFNLFQFTDVDFTYFNTVIATGSYYSGTFTKDTSSGTGVFKLSSSGTGGGQSLTFTDVVPANGNPGTYYGQLVIVPEPMMLGLLGIASGMGVLTVRRYRRRR